MPKRPKIQRVLTPDQQRARDHVETVISHWRNVDPPHRSRIKNKELAAMVSAHYPSGRVISESGFGKWRTGPNIPDADSAVAFALTFDADVEEALTAFGHPIPMTFERLYRLARTQAEQEAWDDAEWILRHLEKTLEREWQEPIETAPWWIRAAHRTLQDETDLHQTAQEVAHLVEAHAVLSEVHQHQAKRNHNSKMG